MSEQDESWKRRAGVPFASDDVEEQLWNDLTNLPQASPSPQLRQKFYGELERAGRAKLAGRWRAWLGLAGARGLVTALSCVVVGLFMGLALNGSTLAARTQLAELRQQVALLNRNLILDRLESDSASKRLRGVLDAGGVAESDVEVARALLSRAVEDRVYSVRSAAIDAIGSQISTPAVADELMALLEKSPSPLVQLALVDLVLRHGTARQLDQLKRLSERGVLHPDLAQHVKASVRRNRA